MSAHPERELARLRARFAQRAEELSQIGFMIRGSIIERFSRCGSAGCACHDEPPRLHGPYWQWTSKIKGKTVTRNLTDEQLVRYRQWMDNARRFDQITQELQEISAEADAILRTRERASSERQQRPRRSATGPS